MRSQFDVVEAGRRGRDGEWITTAQTRAAADAVHAALLQRGIPAERGQDEGEDAAGQYSVYQDLTVTGHEGLYLALSFHTAGAYVTVDLVDADSATAVQTAYDIVREVVGTLSEVMGWLPEGDVLDELAEQRDFLLAELSCSTPVPQRWWRLRGR